MQNTMVGGEMANGEKITIEDLGGIWKREKKHGGKVT